MCLPGTLAILVFSGVVASAQISVTSPTPSQSISGPSFVMTCSIVNLPNIYSAEWLVDGEAHGLITVPPFSLAWNSNFTFNGTQHAVRVIARDALGATLATSADVIFTTSNVYANVNSNVSAVFASLGVGTGTPDTSPWSGTVPITLTVTGTHATDSKTMCLYIDGIKGGTDGMNCVTGSTATSSVLNVDTGRYTNGQHWLYVLASDDNPGPPFGQWGRVIGFLNGNGPVDVLSSPHDFPISQSGTQQLSSLILNQDGTTSAPWTMQQIAPNNLSFVQDKIVSAVQTAQRGFAAGAGIVWWAASAISLRKGAGSIALAHKAANATSGTPGTLACPAMNNANGSAIAVFVTTGNGGPGNITGVTDTSGNTYTAQTSAAAGSGTGGGKFFTSINITGNAANVVTAAFTGGVSNLTVHCLEYTGIAVSNAVDVSVSQGVSGGVMTPAFSTSSADEVLIVGVMSDRDGSPYAPGGVPFYNSANTSICTVNNATRLATAVASFGSCQIIANNGPFPRHTIWGWVASSNVLPHFGKDGNIRASFDPSQSFYVNSLFFAQANTGFTDPQMTNLKFAQLFQLGGFNTLEPGCLDGSVGWGANEAAFKTGMDNYINTLKTQTELVTPNLFAHIVCTGYAGGSQNSYAGIYGPPASYSTPGWTYMMQKLRDLGHTVGFSMADEINFDWNYPGPNGQVTASGSCPSDPNSNCFTSVTSTGTGTCTVHWTHWGSNGSANFGLFGATTHGSLNTTPGGALYQVADKSDANTFPFTGSVCNSSFTADATSDPSMHIEPMIDIWEAGNAYFHYDGISRNLMTMVNAVPNRPKITWPAAAQSGSYSNYQFMGNNTFSDFGEFYWSFSGSGGSTPLNLFPYDLVSTMGTTLRLRHGDMQAPRGWLALTNGTTMNYGDQGFALGIDHISGNTVFFTGPHGMSNITPDISRGWFSGTSNGYYNVDVFFDTCPTATTCTFSLRAPSTVVAGSGGTASFVNGGTYTLASIAGTAGGGPSGFTFNDLSVSHMTQAQKIFTISGSDQSYYNTNRFWFNATGFWKANNDTQTFWREVPPMASSATGGTATIIRDNTYVMGIQGNSVAAVSGPRPMFITPLYAALLGAMGHRDYGLGADYNLSLSGVYPRFHDNRFDDNQAELHPTYNDGDARQTTAWYAASTANQLNTRMAKFLLQPRAAGAPDLGVQFETSLRSGSFGNLLIALYFGTYPASRTVDLSACAISGQATIRYLADWRGIDVKTIAAGTTADVATFSEGGAAYYICALNAAFEYSPPAISARLADVPNATKILVRYAYQPYLLPTRFDNVVDCGTGTCTLPVDRGLGTVSYKLQYLNVNGTVLATSDAQTL